MSGVVLSHTAQTQAEVYGQQLTQAVGGTVSSNSSWFIAVCGFALVVLAINLLVLGVSRIGR